MADWSVRVDYNSASMVELLTRLKNHLREHRPELPVIGMAEEVIKNLESGAMVVPSGYSVWDVQDFGPLTASGCPRACKKWRTNDRLIHLVPAENKS